MVVFVAAAALKGFTIVSGETQPHSEHSYHPSTAPKCKHETHTVGASRRDGPYPGSMMEGGRRLLFSHHWDTTLVTPIPPKVMTKVKFTKLKPGALRLLRVGHTLADGMSRLLNLTSWMTYLGKMQRVGPHGLFPLGFSPLQVWPRNSVWYTRPLAFLGIPSSWPLSPPHLLPYNPFIILYPCWNTISSRKPPALLFPLLFQARKDPALWVTSVSLHLGWQSPTHQWGLWIAWQKSHSNQRKHRGNVLTPPPPWRSKV